MTDNIVTVIPARGGSKGIPKKNIKYFCGKPLIGWTIEQAVSSRFIKRVFVSTEDSEIADVSRKFGAIIIERPPILAADTSSSEGALSHAILQIEETIRVDIVVFLQATSPLRETKDIDNAIHIFIEEKADSLFSASILEDFCIWQKVKNRFISLTYDYKNRGRRQDRKPYYLENGSIYIFKPKILKRCNNRLGGKISVYIMPFWKSFEIDTIEDFELCQFLMKEKILASTTNR